MSAIILAIVICVMYFLPSMIASKRFHQQWLAILMLNTLLGWTFIGWALALIWACTNQTVPLDKRESTIEPTDSSLKTSLVGSVICIAGSALIFVGFVICLFVTSSETGIATAELGIIIYLIGAFVGRLARGNFTTEQFAAALGRKYPFLKGSARPTTPPAPTAP